MKKLIQFLLVVLVSLLAMSCGKFADGTSVWQGGLWIIPVVLFLASIYSFYRAIAQWQSGSSYWGKDSKGVAKRIESKEKVSFLSIGATWFGIIFLIGLIGCVILVNADK